MIVGGTVTTGSSKKARKTYFRIIQNVQLTSAVPKMTRIDNPVIGFSEEDARLLHHPHDDAFVVSIRIGDYNTYRILVDNESSADILGAITLPITVGDYPQKITKDVTFLVVNCSSAYNAILG